MVEASEFLFPQSNGRRRASTRFWGLPTSIWGGGWSRGALERHWATSSASSGARLQGSEVYGIKSSKRERGKRATTHGESNKGDDEAGDDRKLKNLTIVAGGSELEDAVDGDVSLHPSLIPVAERARALRQALRLA